MMRAAAITLALALAACAPEAPTTEEEQQPIQATTDGPPLGCSAQASREWSAVGSQYYIVEAEAQGDTCREAVAVIRIETRDGRELFEREYRTALVPLAFNPNGDQTSLRSELEAWIQNAAQTERSDELPAWPPGAARPPHFQPAVDRNRYEAARGAQGALFCYPDGAESHACVALAGDSATYLGSRTFERE